MKTDNKTLVSEGNTNFGEVLAISFVFLLFLLFYTQAIVAASWVVCVISLVFFVAALGGLSEYIKNIYYFSEKSIVITNRNNDFMGEINYADSTVFWNEYFEVSKGKKNYFLIIISENSKVVISKKKYKNYDEIVTYFNESGLPKDSTLKNGYLNGKNEFYSKLENSILSVSLLLLFFFLMTFGFIVSGKKDTGAKVYFTGRIKNIDRTGGKISKLYLELQNYPSVEFIINDDISFFQSYNYYEGNKIYTNLNKKIRIGISKDEYDWKTKNKLIRCLNVIDKNRWDIEEYKMLE